MYTVVHSFGHKFELESLWNCSVGIHKKSVIHNTSLQEWAYY